MYIIVFLTFLEGLGKCKRLFPNPSSSYFHTTFKFCAKGCLFFPDSSVLCIFWKCVCCMLLLPFAYMPKALASETASNFVIYSKFQTQLTWNFRFNFRRAKRASHRQASHQPPRHQSEWDICTEFETLWPHFCVNTKLPYYVTQILCLLLTQPLTRFS